MNSSAAHAASWTDRCGWMDGWIDGSLDGWMGNWMGGWVDQWVDWWVGRSVGGLVDGLFIFIYLLTFSMLHYIVILHALELNIHNTITYRVSQDECARLRESVPYVKLYRYNPKHLCSK